MEAVNAANTSTIHSVNFCHNAVSNPGVMDSQKTTVMDDLTLAASATLASDSSVGKLEVVSFVLKGEDMSLANLASASNASLVAKSLQAGSITPSGKVKILLTKNDSVFPKVRKQLGTTIPSMKSVVASMNKMAIIGKAVYEDGVVSSTQKTGQWEKIACADGEKDLTTNDDKKCADKQRVLIVK